MKFKAFTLAELLIALAILGIIASFTIPKVLETSTSTKHNSIVKEAAAMVSGAYQNYKLENSPDANTEMDDFTQYMNFTKVVTSGDIDSYNGGTSIGCSAGQPCYELHSGAKVMSNNIVIQFGGTAATNAIWFYVDPDGEYGGLTSGPSKSTVFYLYFNGKLRTYGTIEPNTCNSTACNFTSPSRDPDYFSWE